MAQVYLHYHFQAFKLVSFAKKFESFSYIWFDFLVETQVATAITNVIFLDLICHNSCFYIHLDLVAELLIAGCR